MEVVPAAGKVAVDLTGQVVPDGDVPGRWRRRAAGGPNQRADRYRAQLPAQRGREGSDG
ncbi:hypothetical protein [Micromonospora sp. NPDC057140]|uniref:hypothetical protein n=1 Tax=Micromonospora sp. NPDC057140 TaxID=3346032 RepID=UPI00362BBDF0